MAGKPTKKQRRKDAVEEEFEEITASRLVEVRKKLGLTQDQLIEFLTNEYGESYDIRTIYRWENGVNSVPASVLIRLESCCAQLDLEKKENITKDLLLNNKQSLLKRALARLRSYKNNP